MRALKAIGDRKYVDDPIFWIEYMFPWIYQRSFTHSGATSLWDELIQLRIKCPSIANINIVINYVETLIAKFEDIEGFDKMSDEIKNDIRLRGDLPKGVRVQMSKTPSMKLRG